MPSHHKEFFKPTPLTSIHTRNDISGNCLSHNLNIILSDYNQTSPSNTWSGIHVLLSLMTWITR